MDLLTSLIREGLYLCYTIIPNWGMAIVLLTITIRVVLFPLQIFTLRQQEKMKQLKPQLDSLQERFKSDGRRLLAERSAILKENGARPWVTMLLTLIQLPLLISMFKAISDNPALQSASFVWIPNLAAADPTFILPILLSLACWLQYRGQNQEGTIGSILAIANFAFMVTMPAGVGLYSLANTALQLVSQRTISSSF
jgi:YidC/Oxa1 family membrane protein insertase